MDTMLIQLRLQELVGRVRCWIALQARLSRDERGDVPGWVMIVVMTAGLVAMLTVVAGPQLRSMLTTALNSVSG
jgi:hypothetical protein